MNQTAKVKRILLLYTFSVCALTLLALAVVFVRGTLLGQPYPFNTVLYDPDIRFYDFTIFDLRFRSLLRYADFFGQPGYPYGYPAPAVFATLPFYLLSDVAVIPFLVFVLAVIWIATFAVWLRVRTNPTLYAAATGALLITTATSYPFYNLLDRGNIEGLLWTLLALALGAFAFNKNWVAALLIGAAASMKPFPGILLLLLLARRRYKEFLFGCSAFLAFNLAAMHALTGSIRETWDELGAGLRSFTDGWVYAYRPREIGMDHSLFSVLKQIVHLKQKYPQLDHTMESIHLLYLIFVYGGFAAGYLLYFRKLPILNQLFLFVIASTLFPYVAYDYTLVQLYLPWAFFLLFLCTDVASGRSDITQSQALRILLPCAVIFTPQTYLILAKGINCGGQVKAIALLVLMHSASTIPMSSHLLSKYGENSASESRHPILQVSS